MKKALATRQRKSILVASLETKIELDAVHAHFQLEPISHFPLHMWQALLLGHSYDLIEFATTCHKHLHIYGESVCTDDAHSHFRMHVLTRTWSVAKTATAHAELFAHMSQHFCCAAASMPQSRMNPGGVMRPVQSIGTNVHGAAREPRAPNRTAAIGTTVAAEGIAC